MVSGKELNNIKINMVKVRDLVNLHYIGLENDFNNPQGMPLYFSWGQIGTLDSKYNEVYADYIFGGIVFDTKNFYRVCDEEK